MTWDWQVFLTDDEWQETLRAARAVLRPGGRLVFETRNPEAQAWLTWNRENTYHRTDFPKVGVVEGWLDVTAVHNALVSFRGTCIFESDGAVMTSESTLRFRTMEELADSLRDAELSIDAVREAPDRPGLEWVFIALRPAT